MLRLLARFLGFWLVAAALVVAVVDGAKSLAASALVLTPFAETWQTVAGFGGGVPAETVVLPGAGAPWPLDHLLALLFGVPTLAVLAVPGALLLVLGAKRRRAFLSREFAA